MTSPTHAKCTLSGYLKHLNDSYPPTGKEHSLLCCRACLLLKPPFWKNKTGYHGDATGSSHRVSGYRCVYFPDHVDSGCLLKTQVQLWRSRSSYGTWGQTADGGSQQNRVEFYTLHLQQWRHWIWHTTPTPAGASTGCTRSSGILHFYTSFSDPSAHVSAPLVWKELIRQRRKRKCLTHSVPTLFYIASLLASLAYFLQNCIFTLRPSG